MRPQVQHESSTFLMIFKEITNFKAPLRKKPKSCVTVRPDTEV